MANIEELLKRNKQDTDQLQVPEELEARLHTALKDMAAAKKKEKRHITALAAACIIIAFLTYNSSTLAFYGKKLMGYDRIMSGTLKQLNELEKGQPIEKSHTFSNGAVAVLDGIMLDESQMLVFYTIRSADGSITEPEISVQPYIEGMLGKYALENAQGEISQDGTEIKWIASYKPPLFFEKTFDVQFLMKVNGKAELGTIEFALDRSKAMATILKKTINQTIKAGKEDIEIESLLASPTKTVLTGKVQNIFELAKDQLLGERLRPGGFDIELIANGQVLKHQGSSMSTDMKGIGFEMEYDPLPEKLTSLQIKLISFYADHDVKAFIDLKQGDSGKSLEVLGQQITINKVYQDKENTFVTITTADSTVLTRVSLYINQKKTELEGINTENHDKLPDGTVLHTRTLCFPGTGKELRMEIQRITFETSFDKMIDIEIE